MSADVFRAWVKSVGSEYNLTSPLRVPVSKSKEFILNMNNYRNAHYQTLNKAKQNYKAVMFEQISKLPALSKVAIHYTLYPATKRKTDIDNVMAVHKKFFQDALVECGKLQDDNYDFIPFNSEVMGSVRKDSPSVEVTIYEVQEWQE